MAFINQKENRIETEKHEKIFFVAGARGNCQNFFIVVKMSTQNYFAASKTGFLKIVLVENN